MKEFYLSPDDQDATTESSNPNVLESESTTVRSPGDWRKLRPGGDNSHQGAASSIPSSVGSEKLQQSWPVPLQKSRPSPPMAEEASDVTVKFSNRSATPNTTTTTANAATLNNNNNNSNKANGTKEADLPCSNPSSTHAPGGPDKLEIPLANDDAGGPERTHGIQSKRNTKIIVGVLLILLVVLVAVPVSLLTTGRNPPMTAQLPILPTGAPSATPSEVPSPSAVPTRIPKPSKEPSPSPSDLPTTSPVPSSTGPTNRPSTSPSTAARRLPTMPPPATEETAADPKRLEKVGQDRAI